MAAWVKTRPVVTGAMVMVTIGFLIWIFFPRPGETITDIVRSFGYLEMIPPSNFHGPGTINTIEVISDNKIKLHPTCDMDAQDLSKLTRSSPTIDQTMVQKFDKAFNISAQVKSMISSEISGNQVEDIFIKLSNVKVLLISDDNLGELQKNFIKGSCQEAITVNFENGGIVCQTQAVLEADVVYTIAYKEHVSGSERGNITRDMALKFQSGVKENKEDQIMGKKLFYGVRLAPYGILVNTPGAKPTDCRMKRQQHEGYSPSSRHPSM